MEIHLEVWKGRQIEDFLKKAKRKGDRQVWKGHRNVIATYSRFRGIFAPRSKRSNSLTHYNDRSRSQVCIEGGAMG